MIANSDAPHRLVAAFLAGKTPATLEGYRRDLGYFGRFVGMADIPATARLLLDAGPGRANEIVLNYRNDLLAQGLSPNTVCHRMTCVKSLVKMARLIGMANWTIEVPGPKRRPYRDTRGPGVPGYVAMLEATSSPRDRAILHLLFDLALRRVEVARLDLGDFDRQGNRLWVLGKGRTEKEALTLPAPTKEALENWLRVRGGERGPMFVNDDPGHPVGRLSGRSVHRIVRAAGERAGIGAVRPHGLRHAAITAALDLTNGNVREVRKFSRHSQVQTLMYYDDNREDAAGKIAALVAGEAK